jgi:hypothetical protein
MDASEKRFRCGFNGCRIDFSTKEDRHNHRQEDHWKLDLLCRFCGKEFTRRDNRDAHEKKVCRPKLQNFGFEEVPLDGFEPDDYDLVGAGGKRDSRLNVVLVCDKSRICAINRKCLKYIKSCL